MKGINGVLLVVLISCTSLVLGQSKFTPQFIRISEDNDFINLRGEGTDRFYTNGTHIDITYTKPKRRRYLTSMLLPLSNSSDNLYSIGITQLMFTPTDITRKDIIYGERPYAGLLFFTHSLVSADETKKHKLTSEVDLGVIGPWSFAKEAQTFIHKEINYLKPEGWDNQVDNDILFNYMLQYEKLLLSPMDKFEVIGLLEADAGTLSNKITTGLTFRMGTYNSYFSNYEKPGLQTSKERHEAYKKVQFFFYVKPTFTAFVDNSTLEGGMFSGYGSVYTLNKDSLTRFYMQFEYGLILGSGRCGVSINEKLRPAEYKNAPTIQVGNLTFFVGL